MGKRVERTRNGGTWTEAEFWSEVRAALRSKFKWWKPAQRVKLKARRPYTGSKPRQKWEYQCGLCSGWFTSKEVEIDHIEPVGSLSKSADLGPWFDRLVREEESAYMLVCKNCHKLKTKDDLRKIRNE